MQTPNMQTPNLLCSILFITFVTLVFGYGEVTLRVSGTFITVCTLREGGCCHQTTSSLRKKIRGKKKTERSGDVLMIQKKYLEYILKLDIWPTEGFLVTAQHQAPVRSIRASVPFLARSGWIPLIPSQHLELGFHSRLS